MEEKEGRSIGSQPEKWLPDFPDGGKGGQEHRQPAREVAGSIFWPPAIGSQELQGS
jgi:hypothetical protein